MDHEGLLLHHLYRSDEREARHVEGGPLSPIGFAHARSGRLNTKIVQEFRANVALCRLRRSRSRFSYSSQRPSERRARVNAIVYQKVDSGWAVFGSYAGSAHHPDWYLNLIAEPRTTIEVGTESLTCRA